jgi:hypothetical protein
MDRGLSGDLRVDTVFISIETVIVRVITVKRRWITPDDENFTSVVVRHLIRECVKGALKDWQYNR